MSNNTTDVLWRRLGYYLSPQLDLYRHLADELRGSKVLEIGYGLPLGTLQYAPYSKEVHAYEIDPLAVQFASNNFFQHNISWRLGDITSEVFWGDTDYDAVVMIEVLEHVDNYHKAIANIVKSLRPEGRAYISGPNRNADLRKNDIHQREWTAQEFYDELSPHFTSVLLFDYTLQERQSHDSSITPLIAVCKK